MLPAGALAVVFPADHGSVALSLARATNWDPPREDKVADGGNITPERQYTVAGRHNVIGGNIVSHFQKYLALPCLRYRETLGKAGYWVLAGPHTDCPASSGPATAGFSLQTAGAALLPDYRQLPGSVILPCKRRRGGGFRVHQIYPIIFGAAAAGKVTGKGAQTVGIRGRGLAHADAAQATGLMNPGAGLHQGQETTGYGDIFQNLAGAGINVETDQGMNFAAGQFLLTIIKSR